MALLDDGHVDVPTNTPLTPEQAAMVEANLSLIPWFLKKWHPRLSEDDFEDRCADGVLGLVRAVQKFDPAKGFKFSTYAIPWIRQVQP